MSVIWSPVGVAQVRSISVTSVTAAPAHIEASATQAVSEKMAPPETPAPTAQPPASIAPNPISTAPAM